ncbi:hypothetical protein PV325_002462 [Microctonus aethiopoides]|nr:hypothetical protein PV325_002462 [Microctonus aethiopoides]
MWKISYFLLLIITFDNCWTLESPRLKGTEHVRNNRNKNNQKQLDLEQVNYEDDYNPPEESEEFQGGRLIGRWRNNGEAIEPKWRDGDSIPLVPFEEAATLRKATPKPKDKSSNNGRDTVNHAFSTNKYRETPDEYNEKRQMTPTSDVKSMPELVSRSKEVQNYGREGRNESSSRYNDYANVPRNGTRRYRTRKQKPSELPAEKFHPAISYEREPVRQATLNDNDKKIPKNIDTINSRFDTTNYRNPLQIQIEDYELNDDEYHRPRSRKRRPPQNYEYIETKTPYPSLDFWEKSSSSSSTNKKNDRLNHSPNESQKNSENSELKSLLKMQQIEGLSLSEILQRRNLTLGDLLKGKIEIINALKSTDDQETRHRVMPEKKIVLPQSTSTRQRTATERPKWTMNRRVRIKELRRNPMQTTTTNTNILKEISDNDNKSNVTIELSTLDNERKSRDNDKLSTAPRQIKLTTSPRFNYTTTKPIIITTTTIRPTVRDPVVQYNSKRYLTTAQTIEDEEIMEFSDFAEKKQREDSSISSTILPTTIAEPELTTISNGESMVIAKYNDIDKDLGSTLSIEHILLTDPTTMSSLTTILNKNNDDNKSNTLIEYNKSENDAGLYDANEMEYQNDGPRNDNEHKSDELINQMSVNLAESKKIRGNNYTANATNFDESLSSNHSSLLSNNKIYDRVLSEIEPEARAEIFELISTGANAQQLEQLLKSRNMSVDELISLRQRGSSRVHMADISRLRSRSHKYKTRGDQTFTPISHSSGINRGNSIGSVNMTKLSHNRNSSQFSIYSTLDGIRAQIDKVNKTERRFIVVDKTPIIIKISSRNGKEKKSDGITTQKDTEELGDLLNAFESLPFAIYNYPVTTTVESTIEMKYATTTTESQEIKYNSHRKTKEPEVTTDNLEIGLVEEIARETEIIDEEFSSIITTTTDKSYAFIPRQEDERKTLSKVRPSIIASGAILGMTIVGFLAIFIICRIRQKQKYMYKNTFSKAVFQAPVMNSRKLSNSSSLNTIMVNVVATSTTKRSMQHETQEIEENFEGKSDIDNDSLDPNDSWNTIPDFMK